MNPLEFCELSEEERKAYLGEELAAAKILDSISYPKLVSGRGVL